MKRFLVVCMVLLLPVSATAFNVPLQVEVIASQTIGGSATVTSAAIDISAYSSLDGFFSLSGKCWGAGAEDCKFSVLCYDEIDGTYVAAKTASGAGVLSEAGTIIASTIAQSANDNPFLVEFDMPLCRKIKIQAVELDGVAGNVAAYLVIQ